MSGRNTGRPVPLRPVPAKPPGQAPASASGAPARAPTAKPAAKPEAKPAVKLLLKPPKPEGKAAGNLRRRRADDLGLRRAMSDRILPLLVAAMAFLAALTLAGAVGTASLARHWQQGAGAALTVQVPHPTDPARQGVPPGTRLQRVLAVLIGTPGIAQARAVPEDEMSELLRPWLGTGIEHLSLPLPAVIEVHMTAEGADMATLVSRLRDVAPGTEMEDQGIWIARLTRLARSLQACAALALLVVAAVAAAVIAVATRAGLVARRESIEIVHGLGATDSYIAGRFATRATMLAAIGGALGAVAAVPVLVALANLAAPFAGVTAPAKDSADLLLALPAPIWLALPALPVVAALVGFVTAHATVRRWLRRLP